VNHARRTTASRLMGPDPSSEYGRSTLLSIQTGALHPHLNCGNVKFVAVPVPPISEQAAIVAHLKEELLHFDSLVSVAESTIALLQERRTALISAAVTGKIDVRDAVASTEAA
ncbi:MAG: restriction endonuclease subunit S, partial [Halothiobacillaceae bacterium]